ncbi:MAG TPA: CSLREA domain-containing protein [Fluviicoccus sp.]|nr:CSLREA domain-containing protein [Fluviicoccus sp.]
MKKNNVLLLTACIAALGCNYASSSINTIIRVNTLVDENGENPNACSLREAIKANDELTPFGGCTSGDNYQVNSIYLIDGTYILDPKYGELKVKRSIKIVGYSTAEAGVVDPITNSKPKANRPNTKIDAQSKSRVFNTTSLDANLVLSDLLIVNGGNPATTERGGAILAGGVVSLSNVIFQGNQASKAGGSVYLSGVNATMDANTTTFESSNAPEGAVLSMSCMDNLKYTNRGIDITQSAIVNNGDGTNSSIIDSCGSMDFLINGTTIAKNSISNSGAIINYRKSPGSISALRASSITAAENSGSPVFGFDGLNYFNMTSSLVAFNSGGGCLDRDPSSQSDISGSHNALQGCLIAFKSGSTNTDLDAVPGLTLADELNPLGLYGGRTLNYLPKLTSKYVLDQPNASCLETDQRGVVRVDFSLCDVGSVERKQLTAISDVNIVNKESENRIVRAQVLANDIAQEDESVRRIFSNDYIDDYEIVPTSGPCVVGDPKEISETNKVPFLKYVSGGALTGVGQSVPCSYKIHKKSAPEAFSNVATVNIQINNIPPIAENDSVVLPSGATAVTVDVLANDSDKNDGAFGGFYCGRTVIDPVNGLPKVDPTTGDIIYDCSADPGINIRINDKPALGYITAEREGPCQENTATSHQTCYGGKLTYHPYNNLSPFSDKFTYSVLDKDLGYSNSATVNVINATPAEGSDTSGGGIGFYTLGLLGLLGLVRSGRRRQGSY